jgi:hypothetical protein
MSFNISRCLTHLLFVFLIILVVVSTGVNAQTNTVYSTASIDFGTVGRGGSSEKDVILTNSGNNSSLTYSINFTYVMNTSGQLMATPSSESIAPKSNATVTVRLDVPSDAKEGSFSPNMVVNTSTAQDLQSGSTGASSLVTQVTYTVQGNVPAQTALTDVNVPLVIGVLCVFALIAIGAVYFILMKK